MYVHTYISTKTITVDIAIPGNSRIEEKELEKITKYKCPQIEVKHLQQKKAKSDRVQSQNTEAPLEYHCGSDKIAKGSLSWNS